MCKGNFKTEYIALLRKKIRTFTNGFKLGGGRQISTGGLLFRLVLETACSVTVQKSAKGWKYNK